MGIGLDYTELRDSEVLVENIMYFGSFELRGIWDHFVIKKYCFSPNYKFFCCLF